MENKNLVVQNFGIVEAFPPADNNAGVNGNYVSMKFNNHATVIIQTGALANIDGTIALGQATNAAGAGAAALAFARYWTNAAAVATSVLVETAAATFDLAVANAMYVIEVDATSLLVATNYDYIRVELGASAGGACLSSALYLMTQTRYKDQQLADLLV